MEVYYLCKPTPPTFFFFFLLSGHLCSHSRNFIKYLCLRDRLVSVKTCLKYYLSTRNLKPIAKIMETNRRHIFQQGRVYITLTLKENFKFLISKLVGISKFIHELCSSFYAGWIHF